MPAMSSSCVWEDSSSAGSFQPDSLCDSFLDSVMLLADHRLLLAGVALVDMTESFVVLVSL